ncbi:endocuticle structural protein SgAbd-6-like [Battus philenor]|uniref:endocuticle structural protein SgAbd-6-like n=1 Tax=Battus philenor TaxID=42288 RepID=UPI0035D01A5D
MCNFVWQVLVLCVLGVVSAVPAPSFLDSVSDCYDSIYDNSGKYYRINVFNGQHGSYQYSFEQLDGTKQEQQGGIISDGAGGHLFVKGIFSYIGRDGVRYTTKYNADDNGYQPIIEQGPGGSVPDAVVASMLG